MILGIPDETTPGGTRYMFISNPFMSKALNWASGSLGFTPFTGVGRRQAVPQFPNTDPLASQKFDFAKQQHSDLMRFREEESKFAKEKFEFQKKAWEKDYELRLRQLEEMARRTNILERLQKAAPDVKDENIPKKEDKKEEKTEGEE